MRIPLEVVSDQGINADGSEPIGWLAGVYTLGLFVLVGLLLWSFVRTMRRAQQTWQHEGEHARWQGAGADQRLSNGPTMRRKNGGALPPDGPDQN